MGVDVSEQPEQSEAESQAQAGKRRNRNQATLAESQAAELPPVGLIAQLRHELTTGLRELQWREVLLFGVLSGALMSLSFLQGSALSIVAGIVPVGTGLLLGRRIKSHYSLHGFVTGLIGAVVGAIVLGVLIFLTPLGATMPNSLGPAAHIYAAECLGAAGRLHRLLADRLLHLRHRHGRPHRGAQPQNPRRGRHARRPAGKARHHPLGRRHPRAVAAAAWHLCQHDLQEAGLRVQGLRFIDKDKHLDLWMEHEGEPYHMRLSVADKVSTGTIESLNQEMKREGIRKGLVITSTEFMPSAAKSAKGRAIVLIDGETLYQMSEKKLGNPAFSKLEERRIPLPTGNSLEGLLYSDF